MDNATIQKFNDKLRELADNGVVEVGLEVGSDPGLSPEEYIQIPASMLKNCAVRLDSTSIAVYSTLPNARAVAGAPTERDAALSAAQQALANGWISCEWIEMHANTLRAHFEGRYLAIDRVVVDPHTVEDVRNFVTVNQGHMRDAEFNDAERNRILAIRFWAVATGLVATSKSEEIHGRPRSHHPARPSRRDGHLRPWLRRERTHCCCCSCYQLEEVQPLHWGQLGNRLPSPLARQRRLLVG